MALLILGPSRILFGSIILLSASLLTLEAINSLISGFSCSFTGSRCPWNYRTLDCFSHTQIKYFINFFRTIFKFPSTLFHYFIYKWWWKFWCISTIFTRRFDSILQGQCNINTLWQYFSYSYTWAYATLIMRAFTFLDLISWFHYLPLIW